jgi:hypothetical protein
MRRACATNIVISFLFVCSLPGLSAYAQDTSSEVVPAPVTVAPKFALSARPEVAVRNSALPEAPPAHAFWDKTNAWLFTGIGVTRALDYASTKNMLARGREEILLPDDVVKNDGGFAALEAAATGTSIGVSYLLHRTGHHSLERWVSITHISVTGFGAVRNYCLVSKHQAPPAH